MVGKLGAVLVVCAVQMLGASRADAQGTIVGRVINAQGNQPLAAVQISIASLDIGVLSATSGNFRLLNVPAGAYEVVAELIGYTRGAEQITISSGQTLQLMFTLREEALALDEIIVTGTAGQARRREVGNGIAQVNPSSVPEVISNVASLLQGRAPGLSVRGSTGQPGSGSQVRLRGVTSASMGNQPLIYVDGIRMRGEGYGAAPGGSRSANVTFSTLDDINPNDIERIEVIKGPAATTLYGTEAAAGVIQIFTKRGLNAPATWTFETRQGFSRPRRMAPDPEPFFRMDPLLRTAYQQEYQLSVAGGAENMSYYLSGSRSADEGIWGRDELKTTRIRANLRFQPSPSLVVDVSTGYTAKDSDLSTGGRNPEGPVTIAIRGPRGSGYGDQYVDAMNRTNEQQNLETHGHLLTGVTATFNQRANITHRFVWGLDHLTADQRNIREFGFIIFPAGVVLTRWWDNQIQSFEYVGRLGWKPTGSLNVDMSVGSQFQETVTKSTEAGTERLAGPGDPTAGSGSVPSVSESRIRMVAGGVFGQILVGYADRYFLTLGARMDGNSAFGADLALEAYPKVAASYVISDEPWWLEGLGTMKLRSAYGQAGRAPGAFDAVRTWGPTALLGSPAFLPGSVGNPNLAPERSREWEFGFDNSMWGDRLTVDFTYYRKTTDNALFAVQQIPSSGWSGSQLENVGKVRNSGIELAVQAEVVRGESFTWSVGGSLSTNHSLVEDMGDAAPILFGGQRGSTWVMEGQPLPVVRSDFLTNPDAVGSPVWEALHVFGPNNPTHVIMGNTTFSLPWGVTVSARGEFNGGFYKLNAGILDSTLRGAAVWCEAGGPAPFGGAYDMIAQGRLNELTALVRSHCNFQEVANSAGAGRADYFRLRDVSLRIPLPADRLPGMSERGVRASLTLSATNYAGWNHSDVLAFDPDSSPGGGDNSLSQASNWIYDHSPLPKTLTAALRVQF